MQGVLNRLRGFFLFLLYFLFGLTDQVKRVWSTSVADATLAPSYSFKGAGGIAPQTRWPLMAGTG